MMMDNIPKEWIEEQWKKALKKHPLENIYDTVVFVTMIEALQRDKRVSRGIMGDYLGVARARANDMLRSIGDEDNQRDSTGTVA